MQFFFENIVKRVYIELICQIVLLTMIKFVNLYLFERSNLVKISSLIYNHGSFLYIFLRVR